LIRYAGTVAERMARQLRLGVNPEGDAQVDLMSIKVQREALDVPPADIAIAEMVVIENVLRMVLQKTGELPIK